MPRPKTSIWFMTINSHIGLKQIPVNERQAVEDRIKDVVVRIINENFYDSIQFNTPPYVMGKKVRENRVITEQRVLIEEMRRVQGLRHYLKFEIQEKNNARQYHTHSILKLTHRNFINIDYTKMKLMIQRAFEYDPVLKQYLVKRPENTTAGGSMPSYKKVKTDFKLVKEKDINNLFQYLDEDTGIIWERDKVSAYYKELKEKNIKDDGETHIKTFKKIDAVPEGFIPGQDQ